MSMAHFISNMNLLESMKMQRLILFWNTGISLANCKTKNIQLLYLNAVPCHVNNFFLNILLKSAWHCDVRLQNYGAVIFVLLLGSPCSLSRTVSILGLYPKHRNLCFGIASAVSHFVILSYTKNISVYIALPSQVEPSPGYPSLQVHVNPPAKLLQLASALHPALPVAHSSTSATVSTF